MSNVLCAKDQMNHTLDTELIKRFLTKRSALNLKAAIFFSMDEQFKFYSRFANMNIFTHTWCLSLVALHTIEGKLQKKLAIYFKDKIRGGMFPPLFLAPAGPYPAPTITLRDIFNLYWT